MAQILCKETPGSALLLVGGVLALVWAGDGLLAIFFFVAGLSNGLVGR